MIARTWAIPVATVLTAAAVLSPDTVTARLAQTLPAGSIVHVCPALGQIVTTPPAGWTPLNFNQPASIAVYGTGNKGLQCIYTRNGGNPQQFRIFRLCPPAAPKAVLLTVNKGACIPVS